MVVDRAVAPVALGAFDSGSTIGGGGLAMKMDFCQKQAACATD
jgi:hypothetical protein